MDERFTREYYGACEGGHAATVLTNGCVPNEEIIQFLEISTGLTGHWNISHIVQATPETMRWVCKRIPEEKNAKRSRH